MIFPGFVGNAYQAADTISDNQQSINYFLEKSHDPNSKEPNALLSAPGLFNLKQTGFSGPVRGMWELSGGQNALVVVGNKLLLMHPNFAFPLTARPTFAFSLIGTLGTNSGPVSIRDNGQGNIAVIVDGPNLYVYNFQTGFFKQSNDPGFLGSYFVTEIDGFFIFAKPNSQTFYTSPLYWDGNIPFNATFFALKDDGGDQLVSMIEHDRELWLVGEKTTEIWYMQGGQFFPLGRLQGVTQQVGCAAKFSLARYSGGLIWLARSERGNNEVVITQGYRTQEITTPAIAVQINQYASVSDAQAYVYAEEGHTFYVLTFPTADTTWVYDLTTNAWHQRASFDPVMGVFHRQRANCVLNFVNMVIVGDYTNGAVYWQTRTVFQDDIFPLVSVRQCPHLWDKDNRARIRYIRLQVDLKPGSAPLTGTYTNPQALLSWSDDGGQNFTGTHSAPIGLTGQTTNRIMWRRLGISRDRVFNLRISDPVYRDIAGASIQGEIFKT